MTVIVGERRISIADVVSVARDGSRVEIGASVRRKLETARHLVEQWSRENRPVYGLTRGLGPKATLDVPPAERAAFSEMVVRARATGAGGYFGRDVVRAALFSRACGLAAGGAGVRPLIVETQLAMLERGVHPLLPKIGSVGAADLVLCANLALPMIGLGRAEWRDEILPGDVAMARAGIPTLRLEEKEGLALCSANAVSVGLGALVLQDIIDLLELADATVALTLEAFRGNLSPFDARVAAARPVPGQQEAAAALRRMLRGSGLFQPGAARRVQDPLSLRCVSQVHGALRACIDFAQPNVEIELNSAADNPLILAAEQEVLSNGNFHTPAMAIAFDALRLAVSQLGSISASRVARSMNPDLSGLPGGLSSSGVASAGFGLIRLVAQTLSKELRYLASPVSIDDHGVMDVEDHSPMTPVAVRRTAEQIELLRQVLACELIVSAQALELRAPARVAPVAQALFQLVRGAVAPLEDDRSTTEDIETVTAMIGKGLFLKAVREALPRGSNKG
jgi:histidine ammonia-lyase